jgi:hypothetical protein
VILRSTTQVKDFKTPSTATNQLLEGHPASTALHMEVLRKHPGEKHQLRRRILFQSSCPPFGCLTMVLDNLDFAVSHQQAAPYATCTRRCDFPSFFILLDRKVIGWILLHPI